MEIVVSEGESGRYSEVLGRTYGNRNEERGIWEIPGKSVREWSGFGACHRKGVASVTVGDCESAPQGSQKGTWFRKSRELPFGLTGVYVSLTDVLYFSTGSPLSDAR